MITDARSSDGRGSSGQRLPAAGSVRPTGLLVINADDWGRDRETTDRTFEYIQRGTVSSVSAMMFMQDSERAAAIARERNVDAGLHLNFTTEFSAPDVPAQLAKHQRRISRYLRGHRLAQVVFHPGLMRAFEFVVTAQINEFSRLYGRQPDRIDGHHHMHLCANVVLPNLLPPGTKVRRNFSFQPGEKGFVNRFYRRLVDAILARQHQVTDYFYSLPPLEPESRLQQIVSLARRSVVELETHPVVAEEYGFLTGGAMLRCAGDLQIAPSFSMKGEGTARR